MKNKSGLKSILIILGVVLTIAFLSNTIKGESIRLKNEAVSFLKSGWTYDSKMGPQKLEPLPLTLPVQEDDPYRIYRTLGSDFRENQSICFRASLQTVEIWLEGENIYKIDSRKGLPVPSQWVLVDIPENSDGKTISIVYNSPFKGMTGVINEIFYASRGGTLFFVFQQYMPDLFISSIVFLLGAVISVSAIVLKDLWKKEILYLGVFSLGLSLWLLAESRMMQFFTGSQFYIGGLAYIMLNIFPPAFLLYTRDAIVESGKVYYTAVVKIYAANLALCLGLQLLGIKSFFETMPITHTLILLSILGTLYHLILEARNRKNNKAAAFIKSILLLFVFALIEMGNLYFYDAFSTSYFAKIGFVVFILIQIINSGKRLLIYIQKSNEAEVYEKLAFRDKVTGGKNRMAFERDLESYFEEKDRLNCFRLLFLDLNGLKHINDTYGHTIGDEAIKKAYQCLKDVFGNYGESYRIGGDEYACILPECEDRLYETLARDFGRRVKSEDESLSYSFGIAIGEAKYSHLEDQSPRDLIYRADKSMYSNKRMQKEINC